MYLFTYTVVFQSVYHQGLLSFAKTRTQEKKMFMESSFVGPWPNFFSAEEILSCSQIALRAVSLSKILALYTGVNIGHRRFKFCPAEGYFALLAQNSNYFLIKIKYNRTLALGSVFS